jgi:hypothetical protein
MKYYTTFFIVFISVLGLNSCKPSEKTSTNVLVVKDSKLSDSKDQLIISLFKGESFNHPTYVIWAEDLEGNYLKTIFITKSYASGIFGHEMVGDSIWLNKAGASYQPAALPYWTHKKGLIDNKYLVPTPEHPYVDAYTGATPNENFQFETAANGKKSSYRLLLEVNQTWDWNPYWTNNKYPDNPAYKHSAQPSVIYAVTFNQEDTVFYLNPIGHGDPKGENGKLFTNLQTITTAKEIFKSVKAEIK